MENNETAQDIILMEDENGNEIELAVERTFFYNGDEYALLRQTDTDDRFIVQINPITDENGEEMEEFVTVDEDLEQSLLTFLAHEQDESLPLQ